MEIPVRSYEYLADLAKRFLDRHWSPTIGLPIPIEFILDVKFEISIIPIDSLLDPSVPLPVYGFLSQDRKKIYVDRQTQENNSAEYRMTLAHELAHLTLHSGLYDSAIFKTRAQWERFLASIPQKEYERAEWQAEALAGLILVPQMILADLFEQKATQYRELVGRQSDLAEPERDALIRHLTTMFDVPRQTVEDRLRLDQLWDRYAT